MRSSCFLSPKVFPTCNNKLLNLQRFIFFKGNLSNNLRRYINNYTYTHTYQIVFLGLLAWCFKEIIEETNSFLRKLIIFSYYVILFFVSFNQFTWKWNKTFQYTTCKISLAPVLKIGMLAVPLQSFCSVSQFSNSLRIFAISAATSFSNAFQALAYITIRSLWYAAAYFICLFQCFSFQCFTFW